MIRLCSGEKSHIGFRPSLEDEAIVHDHIEAALGNIAASASSLPSYALHALYAVFDGHAGGECAKYLADNMLRTLYNHPQFHSDLQFALRSGFRQIDDMFQKVANRARSEAGSTAVLAIIRNRRLYVANVGDSRAILCKRGVAIALSQDQKPTRSDEKERIERAGGFVEFGRVMGLLAVSRAFGDFEYKEAGKPVVICDPEVQEIDLNSECEFLVLACDGIWDVMSNQDVCTLITELRDDMRRKGVWKGSEKDAIRLAERIVHEAINRRSGDNCTAVVVIMNHDT
eukprot:ANDGO_00276.mRNA.1 putative protein phosphatase 2C 59